MPVRSTAEHISYDLRPAKQCERKMMLDSFFAAAESGFPIHHYRYVGMGANRFFDYVLLHKYFGIKNMISLEHSRNMFLRAQYNCPYDFIDVRHVSAEDFLAQDNFRGNTIYWMDYDRTISTSIVGDIDTLVPSLQLGDFLFATVCGMPPRYLQNLGWKRRLSELRDKFGDFGKLLTRSDVNDQRFSNCVNKILRAAFLNAFAYKEGGALFPFFDVEYSDGMPMVTYGGVFAPDVQRVRFAEKLEVKVPVLTIGGRPQRYRIAKFDLTEKERNLFDRAATSDGGDSAETRKIEELGFADGLLQSYRELLRYYPRYVETLI